MNRAFGAFCSAVAYFTILPVGPLAANVAPDALAISFLPFVGTLIGLIAGTLGALVAAHAVTWAAVVAWIACIVLSGAIHVDGFLDACDALLASAPPERRLEILRDPRHGTFAVVGMAIVTVVWIVAIGKITPAHLAIALAFSGTLARLCAVCNAAVFAYARRGAATAAFAARPNAALGTAALVLACALGWWLDPMLFALVPAALALGLVLGWWASRRLGGGITGDVTGAIIVVVEVVTLIAVGAV